MTITVNPKNKKQLEQVKTILKAIEVPFVEDNISGNDWWNDLSENDKNSIEEGIKDIEEGRIICHEDFLKSYKR